MTKTELQLLATFRAAIVPLEQICEAYFNLSLPEARRRAALNLLPVPTWRLVDSKKAPLMVRITDLAECIDRRAEDAATEHAKSQL